jgi:photosystem II stability/assembly factor-like uncharacterized protein
LRRCRKYPAPQSRHPKRVSGCDSHPHSPGQRDHQPSRRRLRGQRPRRLGQRPTWHRRPIDGGATWEVHVIPGAETLAFRDIEAFSQDVAFVLSNNNTPNARIYKTEDGGQTWTLEFQSTIAVSFYDCFAFWNRHAAIAIPDGENGHFDVIRMTDGHTWENIGDLFPSAQPGEGFFPASGTCITTHGGRRAWAVSGGAAHPRVIATTDRGDTWNSYDIPMGGTPSSGGLSIALRSNHHGIIGGGEVAAPTTFQNNNFARSSDGGKTWQLATPAPIPDRSSASPT